jgi:hypothetical protein
MGNQGKHNGDGFKLRHRRHDILQNDNQHNYLFLNCLSSSVVKRSSECRSTERHGPAKKRTSKSNV